MKNSQRPTNSNNKLWLLVALLLLAILFTLAYKFRDVLKPQVDLQEPVDNNCDLRKGRCTTVLASGGKVSFFIDPIDIPLLKPLKLSVELDGVDASKVEVDFVGIGMEMGYNRSLLSYKRNASGSVKRFVGKAILPVCSLTKMNWEARVLLHQEDSSGVSPDSSDKSVHLIPYRFFTIK